MTGPLRPWEIISDVILDFLRSGPKPGWEIDDEVARRLNITPEERRSKKGHQPALTNDVSWLVGKRLGPQGENLIAKMPGTRKSPYGGRRSTYYLIKGEVAT
jgi:hypothetical protein